MNTIKFPVNTGQHYYKLHYQFLLNVFKEAGVKIELCSNTELDQVRFTININGKDILIDFSDFPELYPEHRKYKHVFKYHYTKKLHEKYPYIHPLSPISFYDWKQYYQLRSEINYTCNNDIILNNQKPYAGALERRRKVQTILKNKYGNKVDVTLTDQLTYWQKINSCLVSVCVPGARNDILDRGQFQYMAFGCCTISPKLNTILLYNIKLVPGVDYIKCKDDYSDLIEKIEWCKTHRKECQQIGFNTKSLFANWCLPNHIIRWIDICLTK